MIQEKKEVKILKECDVLVAGGGIAGIACALAAARQGAKVILVEKQCALGGLATLGLITIYLPLCDGMGNQVIFGIGEELLRLSIKHGYEDKYPKAWLENGTKEQRKSQRFQVQYNPYMFALLAEQLLLDEGVEILYDSHITDVHMKDNSIDGIIIDNKEGRFAIAVKSVADATGDGDICAFAGENTAEFTENRFAAWHYYQTKDGVSLSKTAYPLYGKLEKDTKLYNGLKTDDVSAMIIDGHKAILDSMLSNNAVPTAIPLVPEFRMTRRLVGNYELDDIETEKHFEDSIGMTGDWRKKGPVYQIPFRCLYGKKVKNLITAGRCISVTTAMWDITRVIPTCAVTGQAAGTAAAMTDDFSSLDIKQLQEKLISQGVKIN